MAKYTYTNLRTQLAMLAINGVTDISKLRAFYPMAGWTELRLALVELTSKDKTIVYNGATHIITIL